MKQEPRIKGVTTTECDGCATSKLKRQVRREPRKPLDGPSKRLAIDFHDFEEETEGYSSCMLVTERWSGHIWDFYLQDRKADTIITVLKILIGILESYGIKVQVIECDNELTSQKPAVRRFIESLSIKVEPSPPYTQALNGGAERSEGVVKDKARSMRASSKLPSALWKDCPHHQRHCWQYQSVQH